MHRTSDGAESLEENQCVLPQSRCKVKRGKPNRRQPWWEGGARGGRNVEDTQTLCAKHCPRRVMEYYPAIPCKFCVGRVFDFSQHLEQHLANITYLYQSAFAVIMPSYKHSKTSVAYSNKCWFIAHCFQSIVATLFQAVGWVQICSMYLPVPGTRLRNMRDVLFSLWRAGAQEGLQTLQ